MGAVCAPTVCGIGEDVSNVSIIAAGYSKFGRETGPMISYCPDGSAKMCITRYNVPLPTKPPLELDKYSTFEWADLPREWYSKFSDIRWYYFVTIIMSIRWKWCSFIRQRMVWQQSQASCFIVDTYTLLMISHYFNIGKRECQVPEFQQKSRNDTNVALSNKSNGHFTSIRTIQNPNAQMVCSEWINLRNNLRAVVFSVHVRIWQIHKTPHLAVSSQTRVISPDDHRFVTANPCHHPIYYPHSQWQISHEYCTYPHEDVKLHLVDLSIHQIKRWIPFTTN